MVSPTTFFTENLVYVYFFYGLAFFVMGLAVALESRQASELSLARGAWLLAAFGLVHGGHEWIEMFIINAGQPTPLWFDWVRVAILATSFLFLLVFGVRLLPRVQNRPQFAARVAILGAVAYLAQVALVRFIYSPSPAEWLRAADVLARYSLCIPGGTLTSLALVQQRRAFRSQGMEPYCRGLTWSATAFIWYAVVGQAFAPPSIIFPSMFINTDTFLRLVGFPVQVLRASMAGVVAFSMICVLRAFQAESQLRLEEAREAERRGQEMLVQLNREFQAAARELSLLYEASRLLTTPLDLVPLLHEAIARIVAIIEPVRAGSIVTQTGGRAIPVHASYGYADQKTLSDWIEKLGFSIEQLPDLAPVWISDKGEDVTRAVSRDRDSPPNSKDHEQAHDIQFVALPLQTRDTTLGYLVLETDSYGPYLSSTEAPTIEVLARQLAIAIENALLIHETRLRDARRGELLQRITAAQEAERQRIARELHDETGQTLTGLALGMSSVGQLIHDAPQQAAARVAELRDMCTHAIGELRHLINYLRPSQLDDLGLVAALRWHIDEINRRSPTEFSFEVIGAPRRLLPEAETTLFRIAQEGLNNVVKHANAKTATLQLEYTAGAVTLVLCDDGRGFDVEERLRPGAGLAWGLVGIQERATLAGGDLTVESAPGEGVCLRVNVPDGTVESEDR